MRKILIGLLVIANFISLQYHESIKHKKDNFALCGSSIGASYSDASADANSGSNWMNQASMQKKISQHQANNRLKEISVEMPDQVNLMTSVYDHDDLVNSSFTNFKDINFNNSLYLRAVFKPS